MDHILFWQPPASLTDFQVHQVYCGTGPPLGIDARIVPQRIVWPPKLDIIRDVFFTYIERPDAPISDSSSSSSSRDGNLALRARCVTRTLSDLPSSIHTLHCMGMLDFVREGPSREEWPDVEEIVDSEAATGVQQQMIAPSIPCPHLTELYFRLTLCPLPTSACPIQFPSSLTRLFIVRTEDESGLYLFELRPFPKWSFSPHRLQQISIAFLYLPRRLGSLPQFAALRILQLRIHSVQDELCSKLNNDSDANAFWPPELEQLDIIANARGAVGQSAFERKKRELLKQTLIWDAPLSALRLPSSLKHLTLWSNCPLNHSCGSHHFVPLARLNEEYEDPSTNGHLSGVSQSLPLHLESLAIISVKRLDLLARIIKQHANIRTLRIGRTSAATLEEHFLPTLFDPLPDFQSPPLSLARIHVDVFEVATPGLYLQTYYSNATCGRITNEIRTVQRTVARYRNSHRISVSSSPDPPPAPHSPSSLISSDASSMWWTQCTDSRIGFDWD